MGLREIKKSPRVGSPTEHSKQNNQFILAAPFGAVVLLHVVGCLFPGSTTWGFSCWSLTDPAVSAGVLGLALLLLWPGITRSVAGLIEPGQRRLSQLGGAGRRIVTTLVLLLVAVLLYTFRSKALVYGDGYTVLSDASESENVTFHLQYYFQVLSVYFYHFLLKFATDLTAVAPERIYALANVAGGVIGLWALLGISKQIASTTSSRVFIAITGLSSASILLFFGYIENYTWSLALGLWCLSFCLGYARNDKGPFGLVILAVLATLFHAAALPFAVVALISLFMRSTPGGNMVLNFRLRTVNTVIIIGVLILAIISHMTRSNILVPLYPLEGNEYSVLSPRHIIDVLNQFILVAGLGLALILASLIQQRKRVFAIGLEDGILGTAALLTFLASFWINPDIGAPRDWDLLAFFGLPVTLWGAFRFTKLFPKRIVPSAWSVAAAVVVVVHLGANLYEKNNPDLALTRLDNLLYADPHYQIEYRSADRCLAWASILQQAADRPDLAAKYLERRVKAVAGEYQACFGLGDIYYRVGQYDSAAKYMALGLMFKPDEMRFLLNLCHIEQARGNYGSSIKIASKALELEPASIDALTYMGLAFSYTGRPQQALDYFRQAYELAPHSYDQIVNMGFTHALARRPDSAYHYISLALPVAPADKRADLLCCAIAAALELGRIGEAAYHLDLLKKLAPDSPDIKVFAASLAELRGR